MIPPYTGYSTPPPYMPPIPSPIPTYAASVPPYVQYPELAKVGGPEPTNKDVLLAVQGLMEHITGKGSKDHSDSKLILFRDCIVEFFATAIFVLVGISTPQLGQVGTPGGITVLNVACAFGFTITVLAAAVARFSGAHMNPAVTIGLVVAGRTTWPTLAYIPCQLVGAICAGAITYAITSDLDVVEYPLVPTLASNIIQPNFNIGAALGYEIIFTGLLMAVILSVTHGKAQFGPVGIAPWYIGLTVLVAHLVMIPVDGCSINPARSFGPAVISNTWTDHWVFWVGPITGAIGAALFCRFAWRAINRKKIS